MMAAGLVISGSAMADTIVYSNDFQAGTATDFTGGGVIVTAPSGAIFLGKLGNGGTATLGLTGLAAHDFVNISFTLDAIGSLDGNINIVGGGGGDYFNVLVNSTNVFHYSFANYGSGEQQSYPVDGSAPLTGAADINTLGFSGFPESTGGAQDSIYDITISGVADSSGALQIDFVGDTNEALDNEYYGIDNLQVSIGSNPTGVPEPGSSGLLGTGLLLLAACGAWFRRGGFPTRG
jgi:hypothetical protein